MPVPAVIAKLGSSIGGKLADLTVGSIGKQVGYVISYRHNLTEHKDALKELKNCRDVVQIRVDEARRQGEEIYGQVKDWISKADEITREAEELCAKGPQDCSWRSCPNLWLRHQISREAKKMTIRIRDHKDQGKFVSVSHFIPPKLEGVPPTSEKLDESIESRISIRNQVLEALKGSSRVGLCGLPGVGKTTLAKEIVNIANVQKEIFGLVVWVTVAQNSKLESLQTHIAESAGKKLVVETVNARAKHLLQRLEQEKNVLVVMDDLWERLDLSLVGIPPKCKILFTSRNVELLSTDMNCQNIFTVGELSEEEAWKLFKENAEFDESNHTKLLPLAKSVCQRCGRLPLALVSVARTLKKKDKASDWRTAGRRLEKNLGKYLPAWNKEIGPSLKLSYEYLNSELQSIFLLSAMLSHDPLIKDLLRYAVGLGLLEGAHSMKDARDTLDKDISDLKASSLLLDSFSHDRVTMHDLFRDFAFEEVPRAKRFKGGQRDIEDMTQLEGCTRLVLDKWDGILPGELHCPKLEFFLLNGVEDSDLTIPDNFFKTLNELRAMGFSGVNLSSLPTLGHLQKLRTLCLESCRLEDISQVGNLKSLRVLSFAGSKIKQLPGALAQLRCLQVLDLSDCDDLKVIPPKVLSSLTRLEVLNMEESFWQWEAEGSTKENRNASLDELKHLTNLYDLNIHIPQNIAVPEDLFEDMPLERFRISYGTSKWFWTGGNGCSRRLRVCSVNLDDEMQKLLGKVQDLYLQDLNVKTNVLAGTVFPHQSVGCKSIKAIVGSTNKDSTDANVFHALRSLNSRDLPMLSAFHEQEEEEINAKSKSLFNSKVSIQEIEKLDLRELNRMISSIWDDQLPENSFTNLKTLVVVNCGFAGRLVPFHVLRSLKHLETVVVKYCDKVEVVFDFEELNGEEIQSPALISVPLKELFLYRLPELKHVWSNWPQETVSFPFLEEVEIEECERLTSMFPSTALQEEYPLFPHQKIKDLKLCPEMRSLWMEKLSHRMAFSRLQHLTLDSCDFLSECVIPTHLVRSLSITLQDLEVHNCQYIKAIFGPVMDDEGEAHLDDGIIFFSSLRELSVIECKSLEYIFMASSVAKGLEDKSLEESPKFVFPLLESLRLEKLHDLKGFCPQRCTFEWPRLTSLWAFQCENLKVFGTEMTSITELGEKDEIEDLHTLPFLAEKVIPKLETLSLSQKDLAVIKNHPFETNLFDKMKMLLLGGFSGESAAAASFPCDFLDRFPKLVRLYVEDSDFEKIFSSFPFSTFLNFLKLSGLDQLKTIWNDDDSSQSQPLYLISLETLLVECCCNLITLTPSSASLGNLMHLRVSGCHQLTCLFTDSTAKSLVNLEALVVKDCKKMKEIVRNESEDAVGGAGITFNQLWNLELDALPSLEGFCLKNQTFQFPDLSGVTIKGCHQMKMFSLGVSRTPDLENVIIDDISMPLKGDLNNTIESHVRLRKG
ncbi:unnamed protein product [Cuscuta campestris]|uniref:AAA+ ATPase domain-containing protein n=1 Tax=Cuscuta campestris TaxID=132261 RepID=A0A484LFX5_9ASTE|nr:unnamed protein product [Cuscuta campestris]